MVPDGDAEVEVDVDVEVDRKQRRDSMWMEVRQKATAEHPITDVGW